MLEIKDDLVYACSDDRIRLGTELRDEPQFPNQLTALESYGRVLFGWKDTARELRVLITTEGYHFRGDTIHADDISARLVLEDPVDSATLADAVDRAEQDPQRQFNYETVRNYGMEAVTIVNRILRMNGYVRFFNWADSNVPIGSDREFRVKIPDTDRESARKLVSAGDRFGPQEAEFIVSQAPEKLTARVELVAGTTAADSTVSTDSTETGPTGPESTRGEGDDLYQTSIDVERMLREPGVEFHDVGGMREVKDRLRRKVIDPLENPDVYDEYGVTTLNGVLLYGPPGTGKSYISEALAGELGYNYLQVTSGNITGGIIGQSARNIDELFRVARANQPCMVFMDEIDAIGTDRSETQGTQSERQMLNQLFTSLTDIQGEDIVVMAATNKRDELDEALTRSGRFDEKIEVPPPDSETRIAVLFKHLEDRPFDRDTVDTSELASRTRGFASSDMEVVAENAARHALQEREQTGRHTPIRHEHLLAGIEETESSYDEDVLTKYGLQAGDDAVETVSFVDGDGNTGDFANANAGREADEESFVEIDLDAGADTEMPVDTSASAGDTATEAQSLPESDEEGTTAIAASFVSVRNDVWRAVQNDGDQLKAGIEQTLTRLDELLAEHGIELIEPAVGESIDPHRHRVVDVRETTEMNTVVEVVEPGYIVGEHVEKEARVISSGNST